MFHCPWNSQLLLTPVVRVLALSVYILCSILLVWFCIYNTLPLIYLHVPPSLVSHPFTGGGRVWWLVLDQLATDFQIALRVNYHVHFHISRCLNRMTALFWLKISIMHYWQKKMCLPVNDNCNTNSADKSVVTYI